MAGAVDGDGVPHGWRDADRPSLGGVCRCPVVAAGDHGVDRAEPTRRLHHVDHLDARRGAGLMRRMRLIAHLMIVGWLLPGRLFAQASETGDAVVFAYGHSQPTVVCAPLRACVIEL